MRGFFASLRMTASTGYTVPRFALIQQMKLFSRLEPYRLARSDAHLRTRPRVTPDSRLSRLHRKHPETTQLDPLTRDERLLHAVEDCVDSRLRLRPRKSGPLNNSLNEILLDQDGGAFPLLPAMRNLRESAPFRKLSAAMS